MRIHSHRPAVMSGIRLMESPAENVFLQRHPLSLVGCQMGRTVTVLRLTGGRLLIHSTADFSDEDIAAIRGLGEPAWLLEATNFHDTLARHGRAAFSGIPYLVPPGFAAADALGAQAISSAADEWGDEIEVIELDGMPKIREHVLFHRPSKTLIVADLMFNLAPSASAWTKLFLRATAGLNHFPGTSRLFRFCIKDREAFRESLHRITALDFERVVVAHGEAITTEAKPRFLAALEWADVGS